jgi:cytochrome c-type biogenesis protein
MNLSVFTAFLAGLISFLSPCVLPLVPGYIALISGISVEKLKQHEAGATRTVLVHSLLFVIGFSLVFVAFGASASAVGGFLLRHKVLLYKVAGVVIIAFGIFLLGVIKIPALYSDARYHRAVSPGKVGSFLLGLAFAFGWTPCIGPILGAMLALAATRDTVAEGTFLLGVYSAGLGVPFLLTGLGLNKFLAFYQDFRRHLQWVERVAGVLLIAVGILVFLNKLTLLSGYLSFLNRFAW